MRPIRGLARAVGAVLYALGLSAAIDRLGVQLAQWGDSRKPTRVEREIIERRRSEAIADAVADASAAAVEVEVVEVEHEADEGD